MGWLITIAVLALLLCIPVGVKAWYNADGPVVRLLVGPLHFLLYPKKKKLKENDDKNKCDQESGEKKTVADSKKQSGGSVSDFYPLVRLIWEFFSDFRRKIRVRHLELKLILAGDDPSDLAVNYGRAWSLLGNLLPYLDRAFVIKKREVEVECDFESSEIKVLAFLDFTITTGRLLWLALRHGFRILFKLMKILNTRKGGINNESKSS